LLHNGSPAIAVGLAGDPIAQEGADADANNDGWVRVLMDGYIRNLGSRNRSIPGSVIDFFTVFQGSCEAFAGFTHAIAGDVRSCSDERPSVIGQSTKVLCKVLCGSIHGNMPFVGSEG
jgi:hypothetical protein